MFYEKHLFFCVNQKEEGKKCCKNAGSLEMFHYAKQKIAELGLSGKGKIRVSSSGCLGRCALGPILVIYPEAVWYTYQSQADIDRIIEQHLLHNNPVAELLLSED